MIPAFEFLEQLGLEELELPADPIDQRRILLQDAGNKSLLLPLHRLSLADTPLHAVIVHQVVPFVIAIDHLAAIQLFQLLAELLTDALVRRR